MNKLSQSIEKYILPVAMKVGNEKHLLAIRDAFITMMPITMAGAIAVLLNAFVRDFPNQYLGENNAITTFFQPLIAVNGLIWTGSLAIMALVFSGSLGYQLAKAYNVNPIGGMFVSLSAFVMGVPQVANISTVLNGTLTNDATKLITEAGGTVTTANDVSTIATSGWGFFSFNQYFGGTGLFTAMIFSFISVLIYAYLLKKNIIIKLPDSVPPAVSKAFAGIIPGTVALYVCGVIYYVFERVTAQSMIDWITNAIQAPLINLSQGYLAVIVVTLLVHVLWVFGLHGTNIMGAVLQSLYGTAMVANTNAFQNGDKIPYKWSAASFDVFVWPGGAGVTLALIIGLLWFSKRADQRTVAKLGLAPGLFNINEPIMFGLPVVLNPIYMIPFVLAPLCTATLSYVATMTGLVDPVVVTVPWVMPPILSGFLATAGDWRAIVLSIINILLALAIWAPFVMTANKMNNVTTDDLVDSSIN
ncbi:PTS sugar transporter subunit IIC [uncultured Enterococcus sp.]|uniref:PTS sugar transporter subunit IIC n=1 Tax=uncultured Enterococcus sp. TaxID=167972 RepID=UPI0025F20781|nr:PTS sugar transporter subunit IIC [uncultured Enterococcus sp.]